MSSQNKKQPRYVDISQLNTDELDYESTAEIDDAIAKLPTADVVEVVRCKDCKYGALCYGEIKCTVDEEDCGLIMYHKPQHYCGYGERRENGN